MTIIRLKYLNNKWLVIIVLSILACQQKKKTGIEGDNNDDNKVIIGDNNIINEPKDNAQPVTFREINKTWKTDSLYSENTPRGEISVKLLYPEKFLNNEILTKLKDDLQKEIFGESNIAGDWDASLEAYKNNYLSEYNSQSDYRGTLSIEMKILFNDNDVLSFEILYMRYETGMAHDNFGHQYFTYDLRTGKQLKYNDVFLYNSEKGLAKKIVERLKEFEGAEINENLKDLGFWTNKLETTENFYINKTGICFVYSEYEITSFAKGQSFVFFSFDEIEYFLSPTFPLQRLLK